MTTTLFLYTGSFAAGDVADEQLRRWCAAHPEFDVVRRSVHDEPAVVIRLGITSVPALVLNGEVIAQGAPDAWLTDEFLGSLAAYHR